MIEQKVRNRAIYLLKVSGKKLKDIAKIYKISYERTRQIYNRELNR